MDRDVVTLEVKVQLSGSMPEAEERILAAWNEAGCLATGKALERFDADGSRLELGGVKWFSKGKLPKTYQTETWREEHPDYQKQYRQAHPETIERNGSTNGSAVRSAAPRNL